MRVGDRLVGRVTSGGYGYTVERSIAYAYLPAADAEVGTRVAVEIFGDWVGGEVAAEPLFDPAASASGREARLDGGKALPRPYEIGRRSGGRSAANGSVISSACSENANSSAGRPPARPGSRRPPVGTSAPRRTSTRLRFVAETS